MVSDKGREDRRKEDEDLDEFEFDSDASSIDDDEFDRILGEKSD